MKEISTEQRARARHLDTKTGALAGFCATILTLNATLGRPLLRADFPAGAQLLVRASFTVAVIALALAALAAVVGVMRPMGRYDLTRAQIDAYSDRPKVTTPPEDLRLTWLRTVTKMTIGDRVAADAKARWSGAAVVLLAVGLVGLAGQGLTLALTDDRRQSPDEEQTTQNKRPERARDRSTELPGRPDRTASSEFSRASTARR